VIGTLTTGELAIGSGAITIVVAVLGALAAYFASQRERRRLLYGDAVAAISSWVEMLYRVRRRSKGQFGELDSMFHDRQEKILYYEAWIGSESKYLARSYRRLVSSVKAATAEPIREAWDAEIRPVPRNAEKDDLHPDISRDVDEFLADLRSHLSPFFPRKLALAWRNRESGERG